MGAKPEWNRSRSKRGQLIRWAVLRGCGRDHGRSNNWQVSQQESKVNLAYTQARLKSFREGFHGTVQERSSARGGMVPWGAKSVGAGRRTGRWSDCMMISFMGADDGGGTSAGGREQEVVSSGGDDAKICTQGNRGNSRARRGLLTTGPSDWTHRRWVLGSAGLDSFAIIDGWWSSAGGSAQRSSQGTILVTNTKPPSCSHGQRPVHVKLCV